MGTLARHAATPEALRMEGWLYHLLCFAADAAANSQWQLASAALSSFAACLLRGCELPVSWPLFQHCLARRPATTPCRHCHPRLGRLAVCTVCQAMTHLDSCAFPLRLPASQAHLMQRNTLPLLHQLATAPGSPARPAIALVVQALAKAPGVRLPEGEREFWSERLLQWLVQLPGSEAAAVADAGAKAITQQQTLQGNGALPGQQDQREVVMRRIPAALESLAAPAGSSGLHVAHAWLAELIVHLSRQVQPYNAVPMPPDTPHAATEAAEARANGSRWWWPFGSSGAPAPAAPAATGAAAAAAALHADPAGSSTDAETQAAAAAAAATSPYMALDAAASSSLEAPGPAAGGSWWKLRWWPWGSAEGDEPGSAAKGATASRPSDSELALYINASEIGPVYARSVAAALLEASGRVGERADGVVCKLRDKSDKPGGQALQRCDSGPARRPAG